MRFRFLIVLILCAATHMAAQNDSVRLHTDTFRLDDHVKTADMDMMLLDMVAEQGATLYEGDSAHMLTPEEIMFIQQMEREQREADSLREMNSHLTFQSMQRTPVIEVEKSWIKDAEEDRNDVFRSIRNMRTPWRKEATVMAQITQNYVTPNWYQGGSSSFAALGIAKGYINYITELFTWENSGEWRIGGSTVSADSLHKVNTTDDLFRIYSKANQRIVPKIFASFSVEFETRFLPTYKSNSIEMKSAPFSPLRFNAACGVDFKPVKNLSISVSPLAYKLIHVEDTVHVKGTEYGLEVGQQTQHNIGMSVRVEYLWKPVREVQLESKFYFYTNYRHVELDLEVNCDFIINRFFSARVALHPRYDTSVIMTGDDHAKIQFRELVSVGFAHKFR